MVAITDGIKNRLTIEINKIAPDTMAIRSFNWDRDRFDIEFSLQIGKKRSNFSEMAIGKTSP